MKQIVIDFINVHKQYRLQKGKTVKELIPSLLKEKKLSASFSALKAVTLQIAKGQSVGFIGANGSGKSTILKLIAGITQPTSGSVTVTGRVASLIELGAGFHPDLTGRENVYLNGLILGMSKKEVGTRFNDIVTFADIAQFIDEPVKHYSSGMYLRLGFAVAIHTTPDILLIDEILAVGDENFQKKCLTKIRELKKQGVTIVVVSHNMSLLAEFCDTLFLMQHGRLVTAGATRKVLQAYQDENFKSTKKSISTNSQSNYIQSVDFYRHEKKVEIFRTGDEFSLQIVIKAKENLENPVIGIALFSEDGYLISGPNTKNARLKFNKQEGQFTLQYKIAYLPLKDGTYAVSVSIYDKDLLYCFEYIDKKFLFRVQNKLPITNPGPLVVNDQWQIIA